VCQEGGEWAEVSLSYFYEEGRERESSTTDDPTCKHGRMSNWTHTFYCLSQANQGYIPATNEERDLLMEAGLGEKKILIPDLDASGDPKLTDAGGYNFGKCKANSKFIELLSGYCLTSPKILRDRVGNTRTYIIPMQKDLDLSSVVDLGHSDVSCYQTITTSQ